MSKRNAPRKSKQKSIIFLTFFVLFSIPLVVWGITNGSFDIRNQAFDDVEVSEENPCVISLPNVNPYTLEVGKTVLIQVDAQLQDTGISGLLITDSTGATVHQESYEDVPLSIATSFEFTPTKSGTVDLIGLISKNGGGSVACTISSPYDVLGLRALANNQAPEFTSSPSGSKPSQDIQTSDSYEYTITATDADGDRINYSYSFTPGADWLKATIIEDGSNGKLTIKFRGSTTDPASYLANVFIHDGYSKHLRSQSWIISVSPAENDIPIVKVITPSVGTRINQGETIRTTWEGSDLNHIVGYKLYVSKNPTDETSWITISDDIAYNVNEYNIDTSELSVGTYKIIVKATDNQDPALSGVGISEEVVISSSDTGSGDTDDVVILHDPQVINMSPSETDTITNRLINIKSTIIAGLGGTISDESIIMKIDDVDVTDEIKINKISTQEYTLIYQPLEALSAGVHKVEVYFEDTNSNNISKTWTFTIQTDTDTSSNGITVFGYFISQRTLIIIGVGIAVILLAIFAPIIIFSVWKDEQKKNDSEPSRSNFIPPTLPKTETPKPSIEPTNPVQEIVTPKEEKMEHKKAEETKFSAPEPTVEEITKDEIMPVSEETNTPPEPDLSQDIPSTDIQQIYEQVQQAKTDDQK